jgi:osmotically-inducible protein OsmY
MSIQIKIDSKLPGIMARRGNAFPIVGVLLAAYGVAACSTMPPKTAAERASDETKAEQVEAALEADPNIYARHIDVKVDGGVVHLGGYVWSPRDFLLAKNDAASVPGVTNVITQMELMRGGQSGSSR